MCIIVLICSFDTFRFDINPIKIWFSKKQSKTVITYLLVSDLFIRNKVVPGRLETNCFFLGSSIFLSELSDTGINA